MIPTVLAVVLAARVLAAPGAAVKNPDVYTLLTAGDADTLDPAWAWDTASQGPILNVYETLFQLDGESIDRLVPLLARTVPTRENGLVSSDGLTYVIPVRPGVRFHDGSQMTAEDVRYSFLKFLLTDRSGGPSYLLLDPLLGYASTRDENGRVRESAWADANRAVSLKGDALVLRLPRPCPYLLKILAARAPLVVSKAWAVENGDWDGTEATWREHNDPPKQSSPFYQREDGTGPFVLDRWDRAARQIVLTRNERYWRTPARLKTVVIRAVPEFATRKLMLMAGDADAIASGRAYLSQLQGLPGVRVVDDLPYLRSEPVVYFVYRAAASGNPFIGSGRLDGEGIPPDFFSDKDARKAFAYAFDYDGFVADVLRGKGARAASVIPQALLDRGPGGELYQLDLKRAEEHFRKAWGGNLWKQGFRLTMGYTSGDAARQAVCQILKRNVEKLNPRFRIDLIGLDWPAYSDATQSSKLPLFVLGWSVAYPDPHAMAFPLLHSRGDYPAKVQKFGYPELDRLIDAAKVENDPQKRRGLYARVEDLEFEEVPHFTVAQNVGIRVQRDWVQGVVVNPMFPGSPDAGLFYGIYKGR